MRRKKRNLGTGQRKWKSATQWLAYRRSSVKEALKQRKQDNRPDSSSKISKMARRMWSKSHEKERKFNLDKQKARRYLLKLGYIFFLNFISSSDTQSTENFLYSHQDRALRLAGFQGRCVLQKPKAFGKRFG